MHGALVTRRFTFAERTIVQTPVRVILQQGAVFTQTASSGMLIATVDAQHGINGFFLAPDSEHEAG